MAKVPIVFCKICGKSKKFPNNRSIKKNGNYCSHFCANEGHKVDPLIKKQRIAEWTKQYYKRPEIQKKASEYYKKRYIQIKEVNRLKRLKKKQEKQETYRLIIEQRKLKRLTKRTKICEKCEKSFITRSFIKSRFCSAKCSNESKRKHIKRPRNKGIPKEIFDKMRAACNFSCFSCGGKELFVDQYWPYLVQDHIVPVSKGGKKRSKDNIQPLCWNCNNQKSDKM